ncbi:MAG: hypothetical protein KAS72_03250 [Phycisphaerales bacterium]|nr:hypothetical protein [Phycisphaerales bacterium]
MSSTTKEPDTSVYACGDEYLLRPGNTNCGGCGMSVAFTMFGRVLREMEEKITLVIPACCGIVAAGAYPTTSFGVPTMSSTFGGVSAFASGAAAVRDINGDDGQIVCWAGDGGTFDIGIASISGAAERNDNTLYVCYDNGIYGNTGGQRSSATPIGAKTTTTPRGKVEAPKDIMAIMAAHCIPYTATLSIAHPEDFARKVKTAVEMDGFRFLLIHAPCPTGWKSEPSETINLVRIAVRSGLFVPYEVFGGERYRINVEPDWMDVAEYYDRQRRFPKGSIDLNAIRATVRHRYERIKQLAQMWPVDM